MAVILSLVGIDVTTQYNCDVQNIFQFFFGYLAFAAASLLIVLRINAIWNGKRFVIAIATGVWVANVGLLIQSVARIHASWIPEADTCVITDIHSTQLNMIATLITDIVLLLIMLIGLLRLGFNEPGVYGLGYLMWKQGLIWLFLATIAEVPPVVFISLNLNVPFDYMFQIPAVVTMSIAATRIYRSLTDFSSRTTDIGFVASKSNRAPAPPPTLEPMEVAIHKTYETQQTTQNTTTTTTSDRIPHEKPAGLGSKSDLERGTENQARVP